MFLHIKQVKHVLVIIGLFCTVIAEGRNFGRVMRAAAQPHRFFHNSKRKRLPVVLHNSLQRRLFSSNNMDSSNTNNALVLCNQPKDALVPCGEMIDNISRARILEAKKNGEEAEEGCNVEHLERAMRVLLGLAYLSSFIAGYQIAALTKEEPENNYKVELLAYDVNLIKKYETIPRHYSVKKGEYQIVMLFCYT
ncbi:MAG: hypothetical protein WBQ73_03545 [Candidatus Babeliales bacterium]